MYNSDNPHVVNVLDWKGEGFQPLVEFGDWAVALMNWEARFDLSQVGDLERHNQTDEVFVLIRGRSLLFVVGEQGLQVHDMLPGALYNVTRATWHNVIGTRETTWLIVESRGTTQENTDHRRLTEGELALLQGQYPTWLK